MSIGKEKLAELKEQFDGLKSENFYDAYPYCLKLAKCITTITPILEELLAKEESNCAASSKKKGVSK
jgi:hypothetical protein